MKQELEQETYIEEWCNVSNDIISTVYVIGSGNDRLGMIKRVNATQFKIIPFKQYTLLSSDDNNIEDKTYNMSMLNSFVQVPCNSMALEVIQ